MSVDERMEMVNDFVTESREMLDDIEPRIIELEKSACESGSADDEIVNTIFRLFHSIKGMASFLDLQTVTSVTHEAETLLDIFRKKQMNIEGRHVDLLYRSSDFIRGLLDIIAKQLNDTGFEEMAKDIIGEIQGTIESVNNPIAPPVLAAIEIMSLAENNSDDGLEDELEEYKIIISPEMVKRFADEAMEVFEEAESALLELEEHPDDAELVERIFRAFHSFKGNSGFFGYADFEGVSHKAENFLEDFRDGKGKVSQQAISTFLTILDVLREGVQTLNATGEAHLPRKNIVMQLLSTVQLAMGSNSGVEADERIVKNKVEANGLKQEEELHFHAVDNHPEPELPSGGEGQPDPDGKEPSRERTKSNDAQQHAIRVDVEKLDMLLDLIGEMVIAEAMVAHNPDLQGLSLPRFDKSVTQLSKIIRDIQDVSMSMRMIPLAGTFRKMVRLVRDVALKENKKVNLDIIGEETEVDKTIIEQISDPLVHMIRNAVGHGIESPAERRAAGKSEAGNVTIEAKHSVGEVWIIIRDDGRGLDREKILRKAIDRKLVTEEDKEKLKDEDVWKLIFEPGLSTADSISSISGRGVGMDVVKRNIEKLRGKIDIRSKLGQGSLMIVRIPLTLAIIEGMVVRVGKARYTIPIVSIKESFRPKETQITMTPAGLEVANIRGELVQIIRLHQIYGVRPRYENLTEGILILVESESHKCCLFVDELVGQQQIVIKGLSEYLGHVRGVSGFAILGDGEVSMILDIDSLIESTEALLDKRGYH